MTAYLISIREETTDPVKLEEYRPKGAVSFDGFDFTLHAAYGAIDVLEGEAVEGVVIIAFPDMQTARRWYDSPAQQEAMALRRAGGRFRMMIVEAVS